MATFTYFSNDFRKMEATAVVGKTVIVDENGNVYTSQSKVYVLDHLFDDRDDDETLDALSDEDIEKMDWREIAEFGVNGEKSVSVGEWLSEISGEIDLNTVSLIENMRDNGLLKIASDDITYLT